MNLRRLLTLCCLLLCFSTLSAQFKLPHAALSAIPVETMPPQDNAALRAAEDALAAPGRPARFAVALDVDIRPTTHGVWRDDLPGGRSVWRTRISSPGAETLNLGFSRFRLPAGTELYLVTPHERLGPFTPADNEDHDQFWTPVLEGDDLIVEVIVPTRLKKAVRLKIASVNHDFRNVKSLLSGDCNVDVACGAEDGFPRVDNYRDIIRSVAGYSRNGVLVCTGFLVNNTNEDGRPLFMTANHCNITANSAPSLVVYWNFENSFCRQPGSAASGRSGDGELMTTNIGARFLAGYADSDMTLVELDDPVNPDADAYYAGWSIAEEAPEDLVVCVHHPNLDEKRISFSEQPAFRTFRGGSNAVANPSGNFLQVPYWDLGTTEGGSSGSPLFDRDGRVRGQLLGGNADCGNQEFDVYGYFAVSYRGGGTPETRVSDYVNPLDLDVTAMDGLDQRSLSTAIVADGRRFTICPEGQLVTELRLGLGFGDNTPVTIVSTPDEIEASLDRDRADGGEDVVLTVNPSGTATGGPYEIVVRAGSGGTTDQASVFFDLLTDEVVTPVTTGPADGAVDIVPSTSLFWRPSIGGEVTYEVELADNPDFSDPVFRTATLTGTSIAPGVTLEGGVRYYWRVRSNGVCGTGPWSATTSFVTADLDCGDLSARDLPIEIVTTDANTVESTIRIDQDITIADLNVEIGLQHSWIGDLNAELVGPGGITIALFDYNSENNDCFAEDLYVVFSASANRDHQDLMNRCANGSSDDVQAFRSLDPLTTFRGRSARGDWTLRVTDNARIDGGELQVFRLSVCSGTLVENFSARLLDTDLDVCVNEAIDVQLQLGNSYTNQLQLSVTAGELMLDNYTFSYSGESGLLTVDFSAWTFLGAGDYQLNFNVINDAGGVTTASTDLSVADVPIAASPTSPADGFRTAARVVDYRFSIADASATYRLELATDPLFENIALTEEPAATAVSLVRPAGDGALYYWRVVATGPCGDSFSEIRTVEFSTTGVLDFGGDDRQISVFPNPTRGDLTIATTGSWWGELTTTIFDAAGRPLRQWRQPVTAGTERLSLTALSPGVYYLRFDHAGQSRTDRIVVLP